MGELGCECFGGGGGIAFLGNRIGTWREAEYQCKMDKEETENLSFTNVKVY